jgi:ParB family chromosome partitioning protein
VTPSGAEPGRFQIVAGERRWRAAQLAGLTEIPCIVDPTLVDRKEKLLAQAEENLHRENLNPVEEAAILAQLMEARGIDVRAAGELMGKSYRQARRLQQLHAAAPPIKRALARGHIDGRVAVEMVRIFGKLAREDETPGSTVALRRIDALIERVMREQWSLRRVERHAARVVGRGEPEAGEDDGASEPAVIGTAEAPPGAPRRAPSGAATPAALCTRQDGRVEIDLNRLEQGEIAPEERAALIALLEDLLTKTRHAKVRA